jgi:mono/diheme cytochrome c family protein
MTRVVDIEARTRSAIGMARDILWHTSESGPMRTQWARKPFFIAAFLLAAGAACGQDIQNGRGIAQLWCSDCHLVDPQDRKSGRDSAPTFLSIARMKSTTEASLAAFLSAPHGGGRMPDLVLNRNEIEDVSAYILSLRKLP